MRLIAQTANDALARQPSTESQCGTTVVDDPCRKSGTKLNYHGAARIPRSHE